MPWVFKYLDPSPANSANSTLPPTHWTSSHESSSPSPSTTRNSFKNLALTSQRNSDCRHRSRSKVVSTEIVRTCGKWSWIFRMPLSTSLFKYCQLKVKTTLSFGRIWENAFLWKIYSTKILLSSMSCVSSLPLAISKIPRLKTCSSSMSFCISKTEYGLTRIPWEPPSPSLSSSTISVLARPSSFSTKSSTRVQKFPKVTKLNNKPSNIRALKTASWDTNPKRKGSTNKRSRVLRKGWWTKGKTAGLTLSFKYSWTSPPSNNLCWTLT